MSANFVQYSFKTGGVVNSLTSDSLTFTAGNLVVVHVVVGNGSEQTVSSVTDTLGNTYHRLSLTHFFHVNLFGGTANEIWYAFNITGGTGTITASWTQAGGYSRLNIAEYSASPAWGATDPLDTSGGESSTNITPLISLTLAKANELVVGFFVHNDSGNGWVWTNATDRTGTGKLQDSVTGKSCGDFQPASSGGYDVTGTGGAAANFVGAAVAFKVPAAAVDRLNYFAMDV